MNINTSRLNEVVERGNTVVAETINLMKHSLSKEIENAMLENVVAGTATISWKIRCIESTGENIEVQLDFEYLDVENNIIREASPYIIVENPKGWYSCTKSERGFVILPTFYRKAFSDLYLLSRDPRGGLQNLSYSIIPFTKLFDFEKDDEFENEHLVKLG